jgi:hypothetical protein
MTSRCKEAVCPFHLPKNKVAISVHPKMLQEVLKITKLCFIGNNRFRFRHAAIFTKHFINFMLHWPCVSKLMVPIVLCRVVVRSPFVVRSSWPAVEEITKIRPIQYEGMWPGCKAVVESEPARDRSPVPQCPHQPPMKAAVKPCI